MKGDESDVESRAPGGVDDSVEKPQEQAPASSANAREPLAFRSTQEASSSLTAGESVSAGPSDHPPTDNERAPVSSAAEGEAQPTEDTQPRDERRRGEGRRDGFRVRGGRDSNRQGRRNGDGGRGRGRAQEAQDDDQDEEESFTHEGAESIEQDDPLAGAFDLERGTPLNPLDGYQERDNLPVRAKVKSAKEFFSTEILYRFDILEDDDRADLKGSYRLELKGYQGGVWTVNLGDALEVVNRREDAEIVLTMQQRDFVTLVNGQLNPQLAIFAQKMRVSGDVKKAILFQNLLCPTTD